MQIKCPWDDEMQEIIEKIKCGKIRLPKYAKQITVLTENSTKLLLNPAGPYILADRPTFLFKHPRQITEFWAQFGMSPQSGLETYYHRFSELKQRYDNNSLLNDDDLIGFLEAYYETIWGYYAVSYNNKSRVLTLDVPAELRLKIVNRKKGLLKMMEFLFGKCVYTDRKKCIKTLLELSVQNLDPWMMEYLIINEEITLDLLVDDEKFVVSLYEMLDKAVQDFMNQTPYKPRKTKQDNLAENASHILWILYASNDYVYSGKTVFSNHPDPAIKMNHYIWHPRWTLGVCIEKVLERREKVLSE